MQQITEPPRQTDVRYDCDVCVLGGSCTGVFAAVRAARLGAKIVLVERMGSFGGVAMISPAHAAIRVMVNMNQTGVAAGVASVLAMRSTQDVRTIDVQQLRKDLTAGGSVVI